MTSFGSVKLREDSAGDGMAKEGGVNETDGEDSEDSLMLTISGCPITLTGTLSDARLTQSDHILPHPSGPVNAQIQKIY